MRRVVVLVLGVALLVAGCGGRADLAPDRAETLQGTVLAVTQAAADARWDDALALLGEARTELDAGVDADEVSTARYREVDAALDEVESQITAERDRVAAEQAAAQQAAAEQAAADQAAAEQAAAEQAASDAPAPAPAPKPAPPGKDKGKGPGKGGK